MKQCQRSKPGCKHTCPLPCGRPCHDQCMVVVDNVEIQLACGHEKTSLLCYQDQDPAKVVCEVPVERTVPGCGHKVTEPCHVNVNSHQYRCTASCGEVLPCGHACSRPCSRCNTREDGTVTRTDHGKCKQRCQRDYTSCKHSCQATCHGDEPCPLCTAKCEIRCAHSACDKKCCEPCAPCAEPVCSSHCPHSQCRMPCAAPCDWLPCSQRCQKMLSCGCQCPGVCGEQCPDVSFCQNHANEETKAMQADFIMFEPYVDINLHDDPCIFTSCGHIVTVSSLDGYMEMSKLYEFDAKGGIVALRTTSEPFEFQDSNGFGDGGDLKTRLKTCPHCRGPLRDISRYGRIVRRALLDDSVKKFTALSTRTHSALETRLAEVQGSLLTSLGVLRKPKQDIVLDGAAQDQLKAVRRLRTANRYSQLLDVRNKIAKFAESVKADQQPFQRVRDLVETARRTEPNSDIAEFEVSSGEVSLREHLKAVALLLRADIVLLSDVIQVHEQTAPGPAKGVLVARFHIYRDCCEELSEEVHGAKDLCEEVEGHLFYARFAAMEIGNHSTYTPALQTYIDRLKEAASARLSVADQICNQFEPGAEVNPTKGLSEEIAEVKRMLSEGLSSSEMRMVVQAMAAEFGSATGHWYRCENGHAFSVGECGRPMQEARCYACGAGVGGRSHVPTAGVQEGLGERFANLDI
ncbi:hypothetical protein EJ03DRAFT_366077 [Teratosphaeria nubilosa]|uniref:RZ-type domain-containing protein n=1 Tax=Teratosphaeria nubilosa TaxID=161662 RepID=A0A6G1L2Y9_9PEZI|nr:hypothetical protein EJ03DRAFT_366077 [Teratosphaeria nubilosa]